MRHQRHVRRGSARTDAGILRHLSKAVVTTQPLEDTAQETAGALARQLGLTSFTLATYSEAHDELAVVHPAAGGRHKPALADLTTGLWQVARQRKPEVLGAGVPAQTHLALPLIFGGSVVGVLAVGPVDRASRYRRRLATIADLLATAVYVQLNSELLETTFADQSTTLAGISEIAQQLNATLDTQQIVEHVLLHALTLPTARWGAIVMLDAERRLRLQVQRGVTPGTIAALDAAPPSLADLAAFDLSQEYQLASVERFPQALQLNQAATQQVLLPLRREAHFAGVLLLATDVPRGFTATQLQFLRQLTAHGALALSNAAAYGAIEQQRQLLDRRFAQLQAVAHISQAISAHLNLDALLGEIVAVVQSTLGYRLALLSLVETQNPDQVRRVAAVGVPDDEWQALRNQVVPLTNYRMLMAEDFRVSRSFYIPHDHGRASDSLLVEIVEQGYRPELGARAADEWNADDLLLVPLYGHQGGLVGILSVDDPADQRRPTAETVAVLEIFATQAATAIENARLYAEVERQALTDNLTGLANQRHFMIHLGQQRALAERHGHDLSLLALDMDHFKAFNDEFGHVAGNVVLREFAQILLRMVRAGDHVGRWGGEEFLALLPQSSRDGSLEVAERIRQAVQQHSFARRAVTVSIGVAMYTPGMSDTDLLAAADAALYRAKVKRNSVAD